jgi:hypothetical protein
MAKDCTNKDINKSTSKKFISGTDNWKNLKKSYAEAATLNQKKPRYNNSKSINDNPSRSRDQRRSKKNYNKDDDEDGEDFNQHPSFLKFKEQIINTMRKVEEKLLKMESLIGNTSKQINEVVTAQQAIKCDKAHPVPIQKKKKQQQSEPRIEGKAKRRCKSDSESSEDEDELNNKSVLQSQQIQKSDQNI